MKEWLTAREIADQALPDMPTSERGVQLWAERKGWDRNEFLAQPRGGFGGATEYHYTLLPTLAQVAYGQKCLIVTRTVEPDAASKGPATTARAEQGRDARLAVLAAYRQFSRGLNLTSAARVQVFVDQLNACKIAIEPWVIESLRKKGRPNKPLLSKGTLARWLAAKRAEKLHALAVDHGTRRKGTGILETAEGGRLQAYVLALIAHQPHLSGEAVRIQCRAEFGDRIKAPSKGVQTSFDMPPVRAFQRLVARLKADHRVELTKLTNPDLYRSTMKLAGTGTLRSITEPNALWQIDASPVDALCTDGRHSIYVCIDIATRRLVLSLSRTPRASAVALLIRKAILAWGVPDKIKTDNGSDFVARDTKRLLTFLDIEAETSDAYSPEQKGHVERAIRTFQHSVGPLLPGFTGHSVADRKAIEGRKSFSQRLGETEAETFAVSLGGEELQRLVDEWASTAYQHRHHTGLNSTPFQAALRATRPKRTIDERALDVLLMPVGGDDGRRVVSKHGVRIDGRFYLAATIPVGASVFVRQDPTDLGRAYVFAEDGAQFLEVAVCAELSGVEPANLVSAAKETRARLDADATRQIKADMKRIAKGPMLIERALEIARRDAPNVIPLPRREERHTTPQIEAAIEAMQPAKPRPAKPLSGRAAELHRDMLEGGLKAAGSKVTRLRTEETQAQRFHRALDIERRRAAGEPVGDDELIFLGGYQAGPEYRALKKMHDRFGEAMSL